MSKLDIPESWVEATLKDVATINMGQSPSGSDVTKSAKGFQLVGGAANLKPTGIVSDQYVLKPTKLCNSGDIILCIRATIGRYAIADRTYCIGRGVAGITPSNIEPVYLCKLIEKQQVYLEENATGSTFRQVDKTTIQAMPVPVPPLGEQKRIVAKIESTQEKIKTIEQSVTKAEELIGKYREALLQKAFRGELVPQDPKDEPASKLLERIRADRAEQTDGKKKKKDDLPPIKPEEIPFEIPKSWEWVRAAHICEVITKGTTPSAHEMTAGDGQIPFLKVYNLTFSGLIDYDKNLTFVTKKTHTTDLARSRIFPDDVLMNIVGPPLGKVGIVKGEYEELNINQAIALFRPLPNVYPPYLAVILLSSMTLEFGLRRAKRTSGQVNLTLEICGDIPIPLPPLAEQKRIIDSIESATERLHGIELVSTAAKARLNSLKSSILKSAFSGCLVSQNPTEGTGHELLEKIKMQVVAVNSHAHNESKPKSRKRAKA